MSAQDVQAHIRRDAEDGLLPPLFRDQQQLDFTQHHQSDLNKLYMKQQMYFWRGNQGTKRHCGSWRSDQNTDTFD